MPNPVLDITLTDLAYGGDALGRIPASVPGGPDRVVFVPFGIPGERLRVRIIEERGGFARAELLEVLERAPERVTPRCKHFGVCGGCHYQHISYEGQLRAKAEILRDQLRRIGHIEQPPVGDPVPSPSPWNYRNQVQFHLTREGRLGYVATSQSGSGGRADLPKRRNRHEDMQKPSGESLALLPITECHLPEAAINSLWPQLDFEPGAGIERIVVRQGVDDELMVVLESGTPDLPALDTGAGISVVHTYGDHSVVMAGDEHVVMQVSGRDFRVSASSFFQVNTFIAGQMVEHVLTLLEPFRPAAGSEQSNRAYTIFDVYCGVGLFSAFLAPRCHRLIGIESSPPACDDFVFNLNEFDNVELYEDVAGNVLPALDVQPDLMLLDPPRAGLEPAALAGILRLQPPAIVYVSCDPSTLARDARRLLDGGYRLRASTPFDLFPQTFHIESISLFERTPQDAVAHARDARERSVT